jgi:hypothetical protein
MRWFFALLLGGCTAIGAALSCSGGGRTADATTGDDASSAQDASDDLVIVDACGQPPWITLGIQVLGLSLMNPDGSPVPGVQFTSPLCPGFEPRSNDAGIIRGLVSRDVPFYGQLTAAGYLSELAPEQIFDADNTGTSVEMFPTVVESLLLPGFDASASSLIVVAVRRTASNAGTCSPLDGVTLGVVDHPEAHVTYFSASSIPAAVPGATATTTSGLAAITGIAGADFVMLTATKPGCTIDTKHATLTGRVPLENGYVSIMPVYLVP